MSHRKLITGAAILLGLTLASSSFAAEPVFSGSQITAPSAAGMSNVTLTVSGPNGYYARQFSKSGSPSLALAAKGSLPDGLYNWEISGATAQMERTAKSSMNNGRGESERALVNKSSTQSGTFRVQGGSVVMPDSNMVEPALKSDR